MRVCILAEKFPPEFTGSGRQALFLGRALSQRGVQTVGVSSVASRNSLMDSSCGFPIYRAGCSTRERMRSLEFAVKSTVWLLTHRGDYDVLHVIGYCWAAMTSILVARLLGKKSLYKVTLPGEDDPEAIRNSRFGMIKEFALGQSDAYVSISERVKQRIESRAARKTKVFSIPNGVEQKYFACEEARGQARRRLRELYPMGEGSKIVVFVGSIEHRKGVDLLARGWQRIVDECPEARLFLVGPYLEGADFHRQIARSLNGHLGKDAYLVGKVPEPELYYRASDVFVFPSRNEGMPNALLEAMACGAACVVARIEGVTEHIVAHGYDGLLVEQEDHRRLAESVLEVLRSPELSSSLGSHAARTANQKFRMDKVAEAYCTLYRHLLEA